MENNVQRMAVNFSRVIAETEDKVILLSSLRKAGDMIGLYRNMLEVLCGDGKKYLLISVGAETEESGISDYMLGAEANIEHCAGYDYMSNGSGVVTHVMAVNMAAEGGRFADLTADYDKVFVIAPPMRENELLYSFAQLSSSMILTLTKAMETESRVAKAIEKLKLYSINVLAYNIAYKTGIFDALRRKK